MNIFVSFNSKIISNFFSFFLFFDFFIRNVIKFNREIDFEKTSRNETRKKKNFEMKFVKKKIFKMKFEKKKKQYSNFYD